MLIRSNNVAFKTPRTIGHLFPYKDRIQHNEEKSMLVYKKFTFTCKNCESTYIGKTARIRSHSIKEFLHILKKKPFLNQLLNSQENAGHPGLFNTESKCGWIFFF